MRESGKSRKSEKYTVVLAAGGRGTRIQSLNSEVPKPMLPIAGKPILQREIESLVQQGYDSFIITVSHMAEKITSYFGDGSLFGCKIEYFYEEQPLGNFGAVYKLWESGRLTDIFFFLIADAVFSFSADRMLEYHRRHSALATLFTHPNQHPWDSSVLVCDENHVVTAWLNKEDERPKWYNNSVNAGLQILTTELLSLSGIDPASVGAGERRRKVDLDRDVLKPLIPTGWIISYASPEYCKDAGTPERFLAVEQDIKRGRVEAKNLRHLQRAVFLDCNGTINKHAGFLKDIDEFALIPGAAKAVKLLNEKYLVIVIANQRVSACGGKSTDQQKLIHQKMETLLGEAGAYVDGIYYGRHDSDAGFSGEAGELKRVCGSRKPVLGLILQAAKDFNVDLSASCYIGDRWEDVECGRDAGCSTVYLNGAFTETDFLRTKDTDSHDGNNKAENKSGGNRACRPAGNFTPDHSVPAFVFPSLLCAVKRILK